ncbi:MAG: alanine/glycine:cation symporter family protein [Eubacteriales bacterium]
MAFFEKIANLLGSWLTPAMLLAAAVCLLSYIRPGRLLRPKAFVHALRDRPENAGSSPFAALSMALAGTLGVGNLTGVASALVSGGPGAVFWMWAGAFVSIVVKYAEVYLAVKYRRSDGQWYGGAMYYIRDGLSPNLPYSVSAALGGVFAVLCCLNSLVTGNIVQANAAACVMPEGKRLICGVVLGLLVLASLLYGSRKIEKITAKLMPPLTAVYMIIAVTILVKNASLLPEIVADIFRSAFAPRAFFGGTVGFTVREGIRFGVMRGIFSNEAGCGTSPTAHAVSDTKSPHHQACCGVLEVVFDTLILCTMTAFVLLAADRRFSVIPWKTDADTAPVTLDAFRALAGNAVYCILIAAVVLFAYGTIIAQIYYGTVAIGYLTRKKLPLLLYYLASAGCTMAGAVLSSPVMWTLADLVIGIMTVFNCVVLILLRRQCRDPV